MSFSYPLPLSYVIKTTASETSSVMSVSTLSSCDNTKSFDLSDFSEKSTSTGSITSNCNKSSNSSLKFTMLADGARCRSLCLSDKKKKTSSSSWKKYRRWDSLGSIETTKKKITTNKVVSITRPRRPCRIPSKDNGLFSEFQQQHQKKSQGHPRRPRRVPSSDGPLLLCGSSLRHQKSHGRGRPKLPCRVPSNDDWTLPQLRRSQHSAANGLPKCPCRVPSNEESPPDSQQHHCDDDKLPLRHRQVEMFMCIRNGSFASVDDNLETMYFT